MHIYLHCHDHERGGPHDARVADYGAEESGAAAEVISNLEKKRGPITRKENISLNCHSFDSDTERFPFPFFARDLPSKSRLFELADSLLNQNNFPRPKAHRGAGTPETGGNEREGPGGSEAAGACARQHGVGRPRRFCVERRLVPAEHGARPARRKARRARPGGEKGGMGASVRAGRVAAAGCAVAAGQQQCAVCACTALADDARWRQPRAAARQRSSRRSSRGRRAGERRRRSSSQRICDKLVRVRAQVGMPLGRAASGGNAAVPAAASPARVKRHGERWRPGCRNVG